MKRAIVFLAAVIAVAALPQGAAFGQAVGKGSILPQWVDDSWRNAQYPPNTWYVGYSIDEVKGGAKIADVLKRAEKSAQMKIAEGVYVNVKAESKTLTQSDLKKTGGSASETIERYYNQQSLRFMIRPPTKFTRWRK